MSARRVKPSLLAAPGRNVVNQPAGLSLARRAPPQSGVAAGLRRARCLLLRPKTSRLVSAVNLHRESDRSLTLAMLASREGPHFPSAQKQVHRVGPRGPRVAVDDRGRSVRRRRVDESPLRPTYRLGEPSGRAPQELDSSDLRRKSECHLGFLQSLGSARTRQFLPVSILS
jgi:hypothetical protein